MSHYGGCGCDMYIGTILFTKQKLLVLEVFKTQILKVQIVSENFFWDQIICGKKYQGPNNP